MDPIKRTDPSGVIARGLTPASAGTGTAYGVVTVSVPITASGGSIYAWTSAEPGTVIAKGIYYFSVAGTGTVDVGSAANATASGNGIIDGGTMAAGVVYRPGTEATVGQVGVGYVIVPPGSCITIQHNEAATSTGVGKLLVQYFPVG